MIPDTDDGFAGYMPFTRIEIDIRTKRGRERRAFNPQNRIISSVTHIQTNENRYKKDQYRSDPVHNTSPEH